MLTLSVYVHQAVSMDSLHMTLTFKIGIDLYLEPPSDLQEHQRDMERMEEKLRYQEDELSTLKSEHDQIMQRERNVLMVTGYLV